MSGRPADAAPPPVTAGVPAARDWKRAAFVGWVAACVIGHVLAARDSQAHRSATFDEPLHLVAGLAMRDHRDYRLNPQHPPLVFRLAALPVTGVSAPLDSRAWAAADSWRAGALALKRAVDDGGNIQDILGKARWAPTLFGAALVCLVGCWAGRWYGRAAGAFGALLAAASPDILAHGPSVTTDVPAAVMCSLALLAVARAFDAPSLGRVAIGGLALGGALGTKYSAVLLGPALLGLAVWRAWARRPVVHGRRSIVPEALRGDGAGARLAASGLVLSTCVLLSFAVIWAVCGFRFRPSDGVDSGFDWPGKATGGLTGSLLGMLADWRILPESWCFGLASMLRYAPNRIGYLFGTPFQSGLLPGPPTDAAAHDPWRTLAYFPVAFVVKSTLAVLVALAVALALGRRLRTADRREDAVWAWIAVYGGIAIVSGLNIGHRHLFPIYPALFVLAARTARLWRASWWAAAGIGCLAIGHVLSAASVHPYHIPYANALGGGPERVWRVLADSCVDWGQDLPALRRWMRDAKVDRIAMDYFGSLDPSIYGITHDPAITKGPDGRPRLSPLPVRAVSINSIAFAFDNPNLEVREIFGRILARPPDAKLGHTIWVWDDR